MEYAFEGTVIERRGPAPFYYVPMPVEDAEDLKEDAKGLEYWGQVAVSATIGETSFTTALFPKDGTYQQPLKVVVRRAEGIDLDDVVAVRMRLGHG